MPSYVQRLTAIHKRATEPLLPRELADVWKTEIYMEVAT
jgi:hypothetical protein